MTTHWQKVNFCGQKFYGAFSYSRSQRGIVRKYIMNQLEHYRNKNFSEQYLVLLKRFEIDFNNGYVFEFYD